MKSIFHNNLSFFKKKNSTEINNDHKFLKFFLRAWLVLFLFLGMAFAGFTTSLAAEGMATFQAHIYDYVYITGIRISGNNNASSVNYSFLDHEMSATVMAPRVMDMLNIR